MIASGNNLIKIKLNINKYLGLLDSTKNIITNFVYIINKYGFIPNGGRVYYLQRSQPPFLIPIVYEYFEASRNKTFVKEILSSLEKVK